MKLREYNYNCWNLAFFEEKDLENVLMGNYSNIYWMKYSDKSRWFADPFILSVSDDEIVLLVEELLYDINKGRIAKLTVDRITWKLKSMKIILELDTHLSFPMIFRRDEDIIIIPENSASGKSMAYQYIPDDDSVVLLITVCDEPLTDATIFSSNYGTYLMATSTPNQNGADLSIYDFSLDTLKAKNKRIVKFDKQIARNAGVPFKHNGKWYRPAQDCSGAYGKGVVLQEISYNDTLDCFTFENKGSIYPFNRRYHLGLHTLNCYDGMCVIDARGLLHPIFGRVVRPLINLIKR